MSQPREIITSRGSANQRPTSSPATVAAAIWRLLVVLSIRMRSCLGIRLSHCMSERKMEEKKCVIELTESELYQVMECIKQAWADGFDDKDLESAGSKIVDKLNDL